MSGTGFRSQSRVKTSNVFWGFSNFSTLFPRVGGFSLSKHRHRYREPLVCRRSDYTPVLPWSSRVSYLTETGHVPSPSPQLRVLGLLSLQSSFRHSSCTLKELSLSWRMCLTLGPTSNSPTLLYHRALKVKPLIDETWSFFATRIFPSSVSWHTRRQTVPGYSKYPAYLAPSYFVSGGGSVTRIGRVRRALWRWSDGRPREMWVSGRTNPREDVRRIWSGQHREHRRRHH